MKLAEEIKTKYLDNFNRIELSAEVQASRVLLRERAGSTYQNHDERFAGRRSRELCAHARYLSMNRESKMPCFWRSIWIPLSC